MCFVENGTFQARVALLTRLEIDEDVARKVAREIERLTAVGIGGKFPTLLSLLAKELGCTEQDLDESVQIRPGDMQLLVKLFPDSS